MKPIEFYDLANVINISNPDKYFELTDLSSESVLCKTYGLDPKDELQFTFAQIAFHA